MGVSIFCLFCVGAVSVVLADNYTLPEFDLNACWGPTELCDLNDTSIKEMVVAFDEDMIIDLKDRLNRYRLSSPPLEDSGSTYGFNTDHLWKWIKYWAEEYPFGERVKYLNQMPHYQNIIQGLHIHYIRVPPKNTTKRIVPLLMMHEWGSSFAEYYDIIPLLTADSDDRDYAVEVIAVSLPGFAYSDAAVRPGMGTNEIAVIMWNLMQRLGCDQFALFGGDWGAYIGASIATQFPKAVLGYYTNMGLVFTTKSIMMVAIGELLPNLVIDNDLASRLYPLTDTLSWIVRETGYFHYYSTKPDTIGVALSDSPVGFLANMLQTISSLTRRDNYNIPDGGLEAVYTREQLIDNIMLYWSTNKITSATRLFAETFNKKSFGMMVQEYPTDVPSWVIQAPDEIFYMSKVMLKSKFPYLLGVTVLDEGGHFLAWEKPDIVSQDLLKAIGAFVEWHENGNGVCEDK